MQPCVIRGVDSPFQCLFTRTLCCSCAGLCAVSESLHVAAANGAGASVGSKSALPRRIGPSVRMAHMDHIRDFLQGTTADERSVAKAVAVASRIPQTSVSLKDLQMFGVHAAKNMSATLINASAFLARELPVRTCPVPPVGCSFTCHSLQLGGLVLLAWCGQGSRTVSLSFSPYRSGYQIRRLSGRSSVGTSSRSQTSCWLPSPTCVEAVRAAPLRPCHALPFLCIRLQNLKAEAEWTQMLERIYIRHGPTLVTLAAFRSAAPRRGCGALSPPAAPVTWLAVP